MRLLEFKTSVPTLVVRGRLLGRSACKQRTEEEVSAELIADSNNLGFLLRLSLGQSKASKQADATPRPG